MMRTPAGTPQPKGELQGLRLYDVSPTVLKLSGIAPPPEMIGRSLV